MSERFYLHRTSDESGVSGVGKVAEGVLFEGGTVVLCWNQNPSIPSTVAVYPNLDTMTRIHGHRGKTQVVWMDGPGG